MANLALRAFRGSLGRFHRAACRVRHSGCFDCIRQHLRRRARRAGNVVNPPAARGNFPSPPAENQRSHFWQGDACFTTRKSWWCCRLSGRQNVERTFRDLPMDVVDEILLVDDAGGDDTIESPQARHQNPSTQIQSRLRWQPEDCYFEALAAGADVVVMVHPDYQYDPAWFPPWLRWSLPESMSRPGLAHWHGPLRRNAALEIRRQSIAHRVRKSFSRY